LVQRFRIYEIESNDGPKPRLLLWFSSLTTCTDLDGVEVDGGLMRVICPSQSRDLGSTYFAIQRPDAMLFPPCCISFAGIHFG